MSTGKRQIEQMGDGADLRKHDEHPATGDGKEPARANGMVVAPAVDRGGSLPLGRRRRRRLANDQQGHGNHPDEPDQREKL